MVTSGIRFQGIGIRKNHLCLQRLAILSGISFLISVTCFLKPGKACWEHLQQGDQSAQAFLNQLDQKKSEGGAHPFYQGLSPESNYGESDLIGRSQGASAQTTCPV